MFCELSDIESVRVSGFCENCAPCTILHSPLTLFRATSAVVTREMGRENNSRGPYMCQASIESGRIVGSKNDAYYGNEMRNYEST